MKRIVAKVTSMTLLFTLTLTLLFSGWGTSVVHAAGLTVTGSGGEMKLHMWSGHLSVMHPAIWYSSKRRAPQIPSISSSIMN